jgi:hypothetical protein
MDSFLFCFWDAATCGIPLSFSYFVKIRRLHLCHMDSD